MLGHCGRFAPAGKTGLSADARQAGTVTTGRAPVDAWRHRSLKLSLVTMSAFVLISSASPPGADILDEAGNVSS